ncbi:MAG: hypothetical protein HF978_02155 [Desulfobacteraceae bacterium]|nr:hypothetical protein [Desulfobacteraceae bacterium]MBC2754328.1 hypothetical protein [Desulfobacteraceae bacterium]
MANLHKQFQTFHDKVALTSAKKQSLKQARDAIRERIRKYFKDTLELAVPKFKGQGSYAMVTTTNPIDGEFDIDDGVYLQHLDTDDESKWPTPATVHRWLVNATEGHTDEKPIDKQTCVRIKYAGKYHVDLPAYGIINDNCKLAIKGDKGWTVSDPKSITDWFIGKVKINGEQLRRIVRNLKAWADFQSGRRGKMPSGLILTVLASEHFISDDRDDICFSKTINAISNEVKTIFCVYNPKDANEELTERLTDAQKKRFQEAISDLASVSSDAINHENDHEASKLWRKQFGDRFPKVEQEQSEEESRANVAAVGAFYSSKNPIKPYGFK